MNSNFAKIPFCQPLSSWNPITPNMSSLFHQNRSTSHNLHQSSRLSLSPLFPFHFQSVRFLFLSPLWRNLYPKLSTFGWWWSSLFAGGRSRWHRFIFNQASPGLSYLWQDAWEGLDCCWLHRPHRPPITWTLSGSNNIKQYQGEKNYPNKFEVLHFLSDMVRKLIRWPLHQGGGGRAHKPTTQIPP